ncbi:MAG: PfkB family carbohydrate kinase [Nitrososphaeria archaeon]
MIVILNANPSFDRTIIVDRLISHGVLRGKEVFKHADGKGMGIARVLNLLDDNYICLNILGGATGLLIEQLAISEGIKIDTFKIKDESRINTILLSNSNETLVINEPGPIVEKTEVVNFKLWLQNTLSRFEEKQEGNYFVIGGSFPRGFEMHDFDEILSYAQSRHFKIAVDIAGEFLGVALKRRVWMVKVNYNEISQFVNSNEKVISSVNNSYGIENVIITFGRNGSYGNLLGENFKVTINNSEEKYAVGSGDAYFGGLLHGIVNGFSPYDCMKYAAACGGANTEEIGPCVFKREHINKWISLINVEKVEKW